MKKTLRRTAIVGMLAVTGIGISPAWAFPGFLARRRPV